MTILLIALAIYAAWMTFLYVCAQSSADDLALENGGLNSENRLLRRDAALAYRHPSTFARVVDLDGRRER